MRTPIFWNERLKLRRSQYNRHILVRFTPKSSKKDQSWAPSTSVKSAAERYLNVR